MSFSHRGITLNVPHRREASSSAVDPGQVYADWIIANYSPSAFWRVTDCTSVNSPTIPAQLDSARDGTLSGWTLQNAASPVVGETLLAPLSDGTNDYGDVFSSNGSTGLADIFDPTTGSLLIWAYPSVASLTDGQVRYAVTIDDGVNSRTTIGKSGADQWNIVHKGGAVVRQFTAASPAMASEWTMLGLSWISGVKTYANINGVLYDTERGLPGTWSAAAANAFVGAGDAVPTLVWSGWLAYVALWAGTALSHADYAAIYAEASA